jgi:DNA helicase-2/ATP-dependent DNA helicase PcrA
MGLSLSRAAARLVETDEIKPAARRALGALLRDFERWRSLADVMAHIELAELMLDESGYTEMWQNDRSPEAPGRLDNLKELIVAMAEFESLGGFLEHVSLVMEAVESATGDMVSVMTLHSAKGLEFDTVFLPGWEEGLFPHQRSLDDQGRAGLEEERRLAHVGLTRARKRAKIYFAVNRRMHGLWSSNIPSRFLDELPEAHVEVREAPAGFGGFAGGHGGSRFDEMTSFGSSYNTPGWQRAQRRGQGAFEEESQDYEHGDHGGAADSDHLSPDSPSSPPLPGSGLRPPGDRPLRGRSAGEARREGGKHRRPPLTIEGELVAKSTGAVSAFTVGDRVFHLKFGNGNVTAVDGNKLTIHFDKAGEKRVVDSFVERV